MRRHHPKQIRYAPPSLIDEAFAEATTFMAELFIDAVNRRATTAQFLRAEDLLAALQREGFPALDLRVRLTPSHTAQGYGRVLFARGVKTG